MRILLTGASGCVGQALMPVLMANGHTVTVIRRLGSRGDYGGLNPEVVDVDLVSEDFTSRLPKNIDAVVHLAQSRRYREFPAGAPEVFQINTAATHALIEYARQAGAKRFIYTSTGSVYVPLQEPVSEEAATAPSSFYTASKLAAEAILAPYSGVLNVSVLRLFYVYGPHQSKMLVDGLATRIREGVPVTLQGQSGIRVAPTFSVDVASVINQAIEQGWSGVYNVGSRNIVTLEELASEIGSAIGAKATFERKEGQAPATPLPRLDKLAHIFDIQSFTPLASGLLKTFRPS